MQFLSILSQKSVEKKRPHVDVKSNKVKSSIKRVVASFAVAYGAILSTAVQAAPINNVEQKEVSQLNSTPESTNYANTKVVIDNYYSPEFGLTLINGLPNFLIPVTDPSDGKEYLVNYSAFELGKSLSDEEKKDIADRLFGEAARINVVLDTPSLVKESQLLLKAPIDSETKKRLIYACVYALSTSSHWAWLNNSNYERKKIVIENYREVIRDLEVTLSSIDDVSVDKTRLLDEIAFFKLINEARVLSKVASDLSTTESDINRFIIDSKLPSSLSLASSYFDLKSSLSKDEKNKRLLITTNLLSDLERDLIDFKNSVLARQMLTGPIRDFIEESFKITLDTSLKVADALGPITEENSIQVIRDYLVRSPNKVEMAAYLSDTFRVASNVSIDGSISFSSADLTNIAQSTYANARAITAKYSNQDLYLPADYNAIAPLDKAMIAFASTMDADNFDQVAANATVEKDLGALLARVEKNKFKWTDADLMEFRTMYNNANGSPQAEQKFLSVVKSYITVKDARIERYQEPEQVDAGLMPHYVEGANGIEETTTYLAYKYKITYTVGNPFPVELTGELQLKTSDMVIHTEDRARVGFFTVAPKKHATVTFTGYQVLEPNQELTQPITTPPIPELQITMADLQKMALLGGS